jgi:hypothetical protein
MIGRKLKSILLMKFRKNRSNMCLVGLARLNSSVVITNSHGTSKIWIRSDYFDNGFLNKFKNKK